MDAPSVHYSFRMEELQIINNKDKRGIAKSRNGGGSWLFPVVEFAIWATGVAVVERTRRSYGDHCGSKKEALRWHCLHLRRLQALPTVNLRVAPSPWQKISRFLRHSPGNSGTCDDEHNYPNPKGSFGNYKHVKQSYKIQPNPFHFVVKIHLTIRSTGSKQLPITWCWRSEERKGKIIEDPVTAIYDMILKRVRLGEELKKRETREHSLQKKVLHLEVRTWIRRFITITFSITYLQSYADFNFDTEDGDKVLPGFLDSIIGIH
ncbi:uncharacterized protein LOC106765723 [Vigna radiata var. radiata]|uniref:Uncharacterized protein LOC106765723 n=1 Tax=Vigna radiata var. radiata TaxID=3916 RepID=A0A3Q0F741_VIGRR|nr:uncharacterized protein LOC106765723 [Vigna radiata var. radiata]